jgi:hypothetical protein
MLMRRVSIAICRRSKNERRASKLSRMRACSSENSPPRAEVLLQTKCEQGVCVRDLYLRVPVDDGPVGPVDDETAEQQQRRRVEVADQRVEFLDFAPF